MLDMEIFLTRWYCDRDVRVMLTPASAQAVEVSPEQSK